MAHFRSCLKFFLRTFEASFRAGFCRFLRRIAALFYDKTLYEIFQYSTSRFSDRVQSSTLDGGTGRTYSAFRDECHGLSDILSRHGIGHGDRVAILSGNTPNWSLAFFAITAFGRIAVPILPESSENEVSNILAHSGAKAVFVSRKLSDRIKNGEGLLLIDIDTLSFIVGNSPEMTGTDALCNSGDKDLLPDDPAAIIYTSGTTGKAKGAMLSHRNLCRNILASYHAHPCDKNDIWLSVLPMAHTYELSLGVLYPFACGARVCYLGKTPTPAVLMSALKKARPTIMLSVPLIIEKIYRNVIIPAVNGNRLLSLMQSRLPVLFYALLGHRLRKSFGGRLKFFGIGGAKLDMETEKFLKRAKFPYAIGYGMTETAPLICTAGVGFTYPGTTGTPAYGVQVKLNDADPDTGIGEIVCKGENVMLGYYKDPERTASVFTKDGWFRTNDLAFRDEKGRFSIKGRLNSVILGPSGENIYPEEIESVINGMADVDESLVVQRGGRMVALVRLKDGCHDKIDCLKKEIMDYVNRQVSRFSRISEIEFIKEAFEKTATHKIRRMKYCQAQ